MSRSGDPATPAGTNPITQQRGEERERLDLAGPSLRTATGEPETVTLHDLSSQGFRTDWPKSLASGDRVWLKLPGQEEMAAKVAWELEGTIGCKFDVALHPAAYARILRQAR